MPGKDFTSLNIKTSDNKKLKQLSLDLSLKIYEVIHYLLEFSEKKEELVKSVIYKKSHDKEEK